MIVKKIKFMLLLNLNCAIFVCFHLENTFAFPDCEAPSFINSATYLPYTIPATINVHAKSVCNAPHLLPDGSNNITVTCEWVEAEVTHGCSESTTFMSLRYRISTGWCIKMGVSGKWKSWPTGGRCVGE